MNTLIARLREAAPAVDRIALRVLDEQVEALGIRNDTVEPPQLQRDRGAMITVQHKGGLGYAATADLSTSGLRKAAERAARWAETSASFGLVDYSTVPWSQSTGSYETPVEQSWDTVSVEDKLALLRREIAAMEGPHIVERTASLMRIAVDETLVSLDGTHVETHLEHVAPDANAIAHRDGITQSRGFGMRGISQQGGLEILDRAGFTGCGARLTAQVHALLTAPECPTGRMDLLLAPDQMMLQIHESIGHPLELDRILGDERNYAGTSFVTEDMFGSYQYGSALLDVTFDPTIPEQFASYGHDAHGTAAKKEYLIRKGLLVRPLGGTLSQHRAGMSGVANTRASSWNRPPIDRMANLNVEPGTASLAELIAGIERGVFMETNRSWSIDDSRNKFQFGCEYGRLIEDGQLTTVVRNPNYRGISANFWRSLTGVGDRDTFEVMGTPYCGKGEPNQVIRVGHASPACRFSNIAVFGGH